MECKTSDAYKARDRAEAKLLKLSEEVKGLLTENAKLQRITAFCKQRTLSSTRIIAFYRRRMPSSRRIIPSSRRIWGNSRRSIPRPSSS
jgi:hypothetical protein